MRVFRVSPAEALLRIGLAFAFLYPPLDAIADPASWLGYLPPVAVAAFHVISVPLRLSDVVLLHAFGLFEVALALWVLFGRRVRIPALAMAVVLLVIVGFNLNAANFSVVFRDISIASAALALAFMRPAVSQKA